MVLKAVRLIDAWCFWALQLLPYPKQQAIRALLGGVIEAALLQVILVPSVQNESNVPNKVISDCVYGAAELQAVPSVEIVPAPSGLLQDFGELANPIFLW